MKIIIEPKRSIFPEKYHTTREYEFEFPELYGVADLKGNIEKCISQINPTPSGMIGVSLTECAFAQDFFVTVDNGKLQEW